jgi:hypothetical protein
MLASVLALEQIGVIGLLEAIERMVGLGWRPERTLLLAFGQVNGDQNCMEESAAAELIGGESGRCHALAGLSNHSSTA